MTFEEDMLRIIENDLFLMDDDEKFLAGPCWEVKIDKESKRLLFLVDAKEVMSCALSRVKVKLDRQKLSSLIKVLRTGNLKVLKKELTLD